MSRFFQISVQNLLTRRTVSCKLGLTKNKGLGPERAKKTKSPTPNQGNRGATWKENLDHVS